MVSRDFHSRGKARFFRWLTGVEPDPSKAQQGQVGIARVPDERLDWLSTHFNPKKTTHTTLELLDTPGLLVAERKDNARRLGIMRDSSALLVVLNGFSGGDVAKELQQFREELIFADMEIVSNRIEKLKDQLKKPKPGKQKELDQEELELLQRIIAPLEAGESAASLGLTEDEEKAVRSFQLLTLKQEMFLVNVNEDQLSKEVPPDLLKLAPTANQAAVQFALELEDLPDEEREAFLPEDGLGGVSRDDFIRTIFVESGQIVFFTVGADECRAWSIPKGIPAVEAAGAIHTDLSRGFVRGEVVSYEDFKKVGSIKEAKNQGVFPT